MTELYECAKRTTEDIWKCLRLFDENKLEQVDETYFDQFTQELSSLASDAVALEFRILPMFKLETLEQWIERMSPFFQSIGEKIELKIECIRVEQNIAVRENIKDILILIDLKKNLDSPKAALSMLKEDITRHIGSLANGRFFLALDIVWDAVDGRFLRTNTNHLSRTRHVVIDLANAYEITAAEAVLSGRECALKCNGSKMSSTHYKAMFDIFGNGVGDPESAHLMPHSDSCASLWFAFVPWVLVLTNYILNYDLAKKCIHGVIVKDGSTAALTRDIVTAAATVTGKEPPESTITRKKAATVTEKKETLPAAAMVTIRSKNVSQLPDFSPTEDKKVNTTVVPTQKRPRNDADADDSGSGKSYNDAKQQKLTSLARAPTGKKQSDNYTTLSQRRTRSRNKGIATNRESGVEDEGDNDCKRPASTVPDRGQGDATKLNNEKPRKRPIINFNNSDADCVDDDGVRSDTKTTTGSTVTSNRVKSAGIKHFCTNRIKLCDQAEYLDANPCVLIVPILTPMQVANWTGAGYSAIVLAGPGMKAKSIGQSSAPASHVYVRICACLGSTSGDFLATPADLRKATMLLKHAVCAIAKSCRNAYNEELKNGSTQLEKDISIKPGTRDAYNKILQTGLIPVPSVNEQCIQRGKVLGIRKVTFSPANIKSLYHSAPDPVLLVGKAASNWLKRQDKNILPGCDVYEGNGTVRDINCRSTESVTSDEEDMISFSHEADLRGWSKSYRKIPEEIMLSEYIESSWDDKDFQSDCDED